MIIGCNIWMICLELNWLFYDPRWILQLSEFVWALRSSVWIVFNNFLLIDATDRSKISGDQKRLFCAIRLYTLSFFENTPFKLNVLFKRILKNQKVFFLKIENSILQNLAVFHAHHPKCWLWPPISSLADD